MVILASAMSKKYTSCGSSNFIAWIQVADSDILLLRGVRFFNAFLGPIYESDGVRSFKAPFRRIPISPHLPRLIARGSSS